MLLDETYEVFAYDLKKDLKCANKYGRMIEPSEILEGAEHMTTLICKGCNKIPINLDIEECENCKALICQKCFQHGITRLNDAIIFDLAN